MRKSPRLSLEKSSWFVFNMETGEYTSYGFSSKALALTEVGFLNATPACEGKAVYAVTPKGPKPPPVLTLLARETRRGLPDAVLTAPSIVSAIKRGDIRVL
jgi:hypothetical protein